MTTINRYSFRGQKISAAYGVEELNSMFPCDDLKMRQRAYSMMTKVSMEGGKVYATVPFEILMIDERYQRTDSIKINEVQKLSTNWNDHLYDPIKINLHPESFTATVLDGMHRVFAMHLLGKTSCLAEILQGLPESDPERVIEESKIYTMQVKDLKKPTIQQLHKGFVLQGVPEHVGLDEVLNKYDLDFICRGKPYLGAFSLGLSIVKNDGQELFDDTINAICKAGWKYSKNGFSHNIVYMVSYNLRVHNSDKDKIFTAMTERFKKLEPLDVVGAANGRYPFRSSGIGCALLFEDYLNVGYNIPKRGFRSTEEANRAFPKKLLDKMIA